MFDDDLNVGLRAGGAARISADAALFLSKKVAAAQREIVHQLRTEAADQARPETARENPDKPLTNDKRDREDERTVETRGDATDDTADGIQQVNITV